MKKNKGLICILSTVLVGTLMIFMGYKLYIHNKKQNDIINQNNNKINTLINNNNNLIGEVNKIKEQNDTYINIIEDDKKKQLEYCNKINHLEKDLNETKECLRRSREKLKIKNSNNNNVTLSRHFDKTNTRKIRLVYTFYTSLPEENGGYEGITSSGKRLSDGMVASINELPIGTVIQSNIFGTMIVEDRMSRSVGLKRCQDGELPVDVYVPRNDGESNYHYSNRVNNMGVMRETVNIFY